ncbi:hypothetical protein V6N13_108500 [Hibiscus sabdariffa]
MVRNSEICRDDYSENEEEGFEDLERDIPRFNIGYTVENEDDESDNTDSDSLHSVDDIETYDKRRRTCVRHLCLNFKLKNDNQGKTLKDFVWKATRATYMKEFTDAISKMRSMSNASFKWI